MIAGAGKRRVSGAPLFFDEPAGKQEVFPRGRGLCLRQDVFLRHALFTHVAGHGLALGQRLVAALAAARDQDGPLAGCLELGVYEVDRPVHPAPDERIERPVGPDAAAEDQHIVLVVGRFMPSRYHGTDDRGGKQALKVHEQPRIHIGQDVPERKLQHRP